MTMDQPLQSTPANQPMTLWKSPAIIILSLVFFGAVALFLAIRHVPALVDRIKCTSQMRSLGQAFDLYQQDYQRYGGPFPPDLQSVIATQQISPLVLLCPATSDTRANGSSMAQALADLARPGHCSYIYVGSALNQSSNPHCIAMLEDPANHNLSGANVLIADGSVTWQPLEQVMTTLDGLNKGINPPTSPITITPSQARQDYQTNWKTRMAALNSRVWQLPTTRPAMHLSRPATSDK